MKIQTPQKKHTRNVNAVLTLPNLLKFNCAVITWHLFSFFCCSVLLTVCYTRSLTQTNIQYLSTCLWFYWQWLIPLHKYYRYVNHYPLSEKYLIHKYTAFWSWFYYCLCVTVHYTNRFVSAFPWKVDTSYNSYSWTHDTLSTKVSTQTTRLPEPLT